MRKTLHAEISLHFFDKTTGLNMSTSAGHTADSSDAQNSRPCDFGTYEAATETYDRLISVAKKRAEAGQGIHVNFSVNMNVENQHGSMPDDKVFIYSSTVRYEPENIVGNVTIDMFGSRKKVDDAYVNITGTSKAAAQALDLAFGGLLSACHNSNSEEHSFTPEHQALFEQYQAVTDIVDHVRSTFDQVKPRHETHFAIPANDWARVVDLICEPWSQVSNRLGLNQNETFPLFLAIPMDNGCEMRLEFKTVSPDLPLQCDLSLYSPGDTRLETVPISQEAFGFHTPFEIEANGEIYSVTFSYAPKREHEADFDTRMYGESVRGYNEEWHANIVDAAEKHFKKHGRELNWDAEDALVWALEESISGPHDFPPDLYNALVLDVEVRVECVKNSLDWRLAEVKEKAKLSDQAFPTHEKDNLDR